MDAHGREVLVNVEEQLNRLLCDPEIIELRGRAPRWVCARLERRLDGRMPELLGVSPEVWAAFRAGEDCGGLAEKLAAAMGLSRDRRREYRMLAAVDSAAARSWLLRRLLEDEMAGFQKLAGIPYMTWNRFLNCSAYTSAGTADKIALGLGLDETEKAQFQALIFREKHAVTDALRRAVRAELARAGLSITDFLTRAWISLGAWAPFQANSTGRLTSQGTLLKMAVGLTMDAQRAGDFLGLAGSGFVVRRDLVVLACILCRVYDVHQLRDILEAYALDYGGHRFYKNLYDGLEE